MVSLHGYLVLAAFLFGIGLYGALARTNVIRILMAIELMLNAVNINLVAFSQYLTPGLVTGAVFTIFVITVAAAEAAVGLAIVLLVARQRGLVEVDKINLMKW